MLSERAIQAVLSRQISSNLWRRGLLIHQRIAGHCVHGEKGGRRDEPNGDDAPDEPFENISAHLDLRHNSGVSEVGIAADDCAPYPAKFGMKEVDYALLVKGHDHHIILDNFLDLRHGLHSGGWVS